MELGELTTVNFIGDLLILNSRLESLIILANSLAAMRFWVTIMRETCESLVALKSLKVQDITFKSVKSGSLMLGGALVFYLSSVKTLG